MVAYQGWEELMRLEGESWESCGDMANVGWKKRGKDKNMKGVRKKGMQITHRRDLQT